MNARAPAPVPDEITVPIIVEEDIVRARGAARNICRALGMSEINQVKVATATSEVSRNIFQYAGKGTVIVRKLSEPTRGIEIVAHDEGPGIRDVKLVLGGKYRSSTGLGKGLLGCRRLMDQFDLTSEPGNTVVTLRKFAR
jgi:serine/threonine-protein kinase RsbT